MKIAAVNWNEKLNKENMISHIETVLNHASREHHQLVVFPALIGNVLNRNHFLESMGSLSEKYSDLLICPGSYWEEEQGEIYHTAVLIQNGKILLTQKQLYLAKWEQKAGLTRGKTLKFVHIIGFKIAIILSTDLFYPQVSRFAALNGANLILSPASIIGTGNFPTQLSGLWQNVQQNSFFAIESGFKGIFMEQEFHSESIIHAPIEITKEENGILAREQDESLYVSAKVYPQQLIRAKGKFDPCKQRNRKAYNELFR